MKKSLFCILSLVVFMTLACGLTSNTPATSSAPSGGAGTPETQQGGQTHPEATPSAQPVSINDGLGSLNSFEMTVTFKSSGPGTKQSSSTTVTTDYSKDQDARHIHLSGSVISIGETTPTDSDLQIYRIGNAQCTGGKDSDYTWTNLSSNETEMLELIQNMISIAPLIDHPTFVAAETVNDIPSNHFTFQVSGLGVKSGAEVTINQGDYWVAVDGQYIVKYNLVMETQDSTNKDVMHEEMSIEMSNINQPADISFPAACEKVQVPTPTP